MEIVYKLQHVPTGLFYQPITGRWAKEKTNLSKLGKIYTKKNYPKTDKNCSVNISLSLVEKLGIKARKSSYGSELMVDTEPQDWRVIEYKLIEI